jgi:hypothetical protein
MDYKEFGWKVQLTNSDDVSAFAWRDCGIQRKHEIRIVGVRAEIRNEYLQKNPLKRYTTYHRMVKYLKNDKTERV